MNGFRRSASAKRVSNRALRRQAIASIAAGSKAYATLLAVLAQKGGEVVVTQGTIDQVGQNLDNLGYVIVSNRPQAGEFTVRLTEGTLHASESPETAEPETTNLEAADSASETTVETPGGAQ